MEGKMHASELKEACKKFDFDLNDAQVSNLVQSLSLDTEGNFHMFEHMVEKSGEQASVCDILKATWPVPAYTVLVLLAALTGFLRKGALFYVFDFMEKRYITKKTAFIEAETCPVLPNGYFNIAPWMPGLYKSTVMPLGVGVVGATGLLVGIGVLFMGCFHGFAMKEQMLVANRTSTMILLLMAPIIGLSTIVMVVMPNMELCWLVIFVIITTAAFEEAIIRAMLVDTVSTKHITLALTQSQVVTRTISALGPYVAGVVESQPLYNLCGAYAALGSIFIIFAIPLSTLLFCLSDARCHHARVAELLYKRLIEATFENDLNKRKRKLLPVFKHYQTHGRFNRKSMYHILADISEAALKDLLATRNNCNVAADIHEMMERLLGCELDDIQHFLRDVLVPEAMAMLTENKKCEQYVEFEMFCTHAQEIVSMDFYLYDDVHNDEIEVTELTYDRSVWDNVGSMGHFLHKLNLWKKEGDMPRQTK